MSAVEAAVAVADAYGVNCEKPVVLGEAWHVLVHLWPSPVVARVTSGVPGVDPADVERELTVAWHAAQAGAPVVQPSDLLPPGPHRHDGYTLVFWHYLVQAGKLDATAAGRGLHTIHESLADYAGDLPPAGRAEEVRAMLEPFAPSDDSNYSANSPRASSPRGRRCTETPIFSTASKLLPGRSGTIWRRRAVGRVNTTSPPSYWTTARTVQIPKPRAQSPHIEATTRSSSIKRSRSTQPGSPHRSWLRSPADRTLRPPSNAS